MASLPNNVSGIIGQLDKVFDQALAICTRLETGKSHPLLMGHFQGLRHHLSRHYISFVLIPATVAARHHLQQVMGSSSNTGRVAARPHLSSELVTYSESSMGMEWSFCMTPPVDEIACSEPWLSVIPTLANVAVLVSEENDSLVGRSNEFISELDEGGCFVCRLILSPISYAPQVQDQSDGKTRLLPAATWNTDKESASTALKKVLPTEGMLERLGLFHLTARLQAGCSLLEDCLRHELEICRIRIRQGTARLARLEKKEWERQLSDLQTVARQRVDEWIANFERKLNAAQQERLLPSSTTFNKLDRRLEELSAEDLEEELTSRVIKLRPRPKLAASLTAFLRNCVGDDLKVDLTVLEEQRQLINKALVPLISDAGFTASQGAENYADLQHLNRNVHELIAWQITQAGELPRRGLKERFMYGYRPISMAFMLIMLLGGALALRGELRNALAVPLLVLFLAGFAWTFYSFKNENREQTEEQLQRLRDSLREQGRRHYETAHREWYNRQLAWARDAARSALKRLENEVRSLLKQKADEFVNERQNIQHQLRLLQASERDSLALLQQAERLGPTCNEIWQRLVHVVPTETK